MKKVIRSVQSTFAQQSKSKLTRSQVRQHRLKHKTKGVPERVLGWYQLRKKGNRRLRSMSAGALTIVEGGYRGHHRRHWLLDSRCEHVFRISVSEISKIGFDKIPIS